MGGEGKDYGNGTPQPAAHLPFFSPLAAHHSAKRASGERNLPMYDVRFATYEKGLRSPVYDTIVNRKSQIANHKIVYLCALVSDR